MTGSSPPLRPAPPLVDRLLRTVAGWRRAGSAGCGRAVVAGWLLIGAGPGQATEGRSTLPLPAARCPAAVAAPTESELRAGLGQARDRGFLWRLDKGGRRSWLYGTVHVAAREWMFPGPSAVDAIGASDVVALELDPLDADVQRRLVAGIAAFPALELPPALAARLRRRLDAECLSAAAVAPMPPELQLATLAIRAGRRDGLEPEYGIDAMLARFGRALGRRVVSLETPETQLEALRLPDAAASLESIDRALGDLETGRARPLLRRIGRVWAESDFTSLGRYAEWCGCAGTAPERAALTRLLDDRNPGLADAIDALHARGDRVFAAVGSLHLVGPRGIPALLAARGYRVERVAFR